MYKKVKQKAKTDAQKQQELLINIATPKSVTLPRLNNQSASGRSQNSIHPSTRSNRRGSHQ
jgi:hypothetical protein